MKSSLRRKIYVVGHNRKWHDVKALKSIGILCLCLSLYIFSLNCNILAHKNKIIATARFTHHELYYNLSNYLFDGHENFFDYRIIVELNKTEFSNCELCKFKKDNNGSSTTMDLAIGVLFGDQIYNIVNWVRTLRSTGCVCKILFFHELGYLNNFNEMELNAMRECGVVWWCLGTKFSDKKEVHDPRTSRFLVIQHFLDAYGNYFNRVLVNDIFDSIFQKDPFFMGMPNDKVCVSIERVQFGAHDWNMKWVKSIDKNWSNSYWRTKWVINSGITVGPTDLVLKLLFLMNQPEYYLGKNNPTDQASLNLVYYRGWFTDLWIDFKGEHYISSCYSIYELEGDENGFIHERNLSYTPAIIHQFDRICSVASNLEKVCPKMGEWHRFHKGRPLTYMQKCDSYRSHNMPPILH